MAKGAAGGDRDPGRGCTGRDMDGDIGAGKVRGHGRCELLAGTRPTREGMAGEGVQWDFRTGLIQVPISRSFYIHL